MIERTTDADEIRQIVCKPGIFRYMVAGSSPDEWSPPFGDSIHWLKGQGCIFLVYPIGEVLWEMHVGAEFRSPARECCMKVFDYMKNHGCRHVIGIIAETNRVAISSAKAVGMVQEGYLPDSRIVEGRLMGAFIYGRSL